MGSKPFLSLEIFLTFLYSNSCNFLRLMELLFQLRIFSWLSILQQPRYGHGEREWHSAMVHGFPQGSWAGTPIPWCDNVGAHGGNGMEPLGTDSHLLSEPSLPHDWISYLNVAVRRRGCPSCFLLVCSCTSGHELKQSKTSSEAKHNPTPSPSS